MEPQQNNRILLTGGHGATTGIAVIEEIKRRYPSKEIYWIGSDNVISGSDIKSLEYKIYPSMGVKYFAISSGKIQTKFTRYTIPLLFKIPIGFFQALIMILNIKPGVILSFGGSTSLAVVFWGFIFRIPVIVHEQTMVAGRATIASSIFASQIAVSRQESLKYFSKRKTVVTGNPIRQSVINLGTDHKLGDVKTILVMGGSRGSEFINEEIFKILPNIITKYNLIHITGERDFNLYKNKQDKNYTPIAFVDPSKMHTFYDDADIIISRSGANTTSEILAIKRPSILIPLPKTYLDEQIKNARYLEKIGLAKVLLETQVTPEVLIDNINWMFENWANIIQKSSKFISPDIKASEKLIDLVGEYIG